MVDADLKSYFDTIPHERLLSRLQERIADGPLLGLIAAFLRAGILDGLSSWTPTRGRAGCGPESAPEQHLSEPAGPPSGAQQGYEMVRYADDFVILCRTADGLDGQRNWSGSGWPTTVSRCIRTRRRSWTCGKRVSTSWATTS